MRSFPSIQAFLAHVATLPAAVQTAERQGGEAAGAALVEHAKDRIGQELDSWAPLAASTVEQKQRMGWTGRISETDPLFARGELRASIGYTADQSGVTLGSTDPIAEYQEFGTSRMPPRPFIGSTMAEHGHEAADTIAEHVVAAMASSPAPRGKS